TEVDNVTPDFFATLQLPLKQGAVFSSQLKPDDPPVIIINETFAQRIWPGESPVGRRVRFTTGDTWLQVIGVVGDARLAVRLDTPETRLQLYRPLVQAPSRYFSLAVRATTPEMLAPGVRQAVAAIDPDLPVAGANSVRTSVDRNLANFNLVI